MLWIIKSTHAWERLVQQSIVFSALRHLYGQLRSRGASQVSIVVRTWRGFLAGQWAQASGNAQALHKGNSKWSDWRTMVLTSGTHENLLQAHSSQDSQSQKSWGMWLGKCSFGIYQELEEGDFTRSGLALSLVIIWVRVILVGQTQQKIFSIKC